MALGVRGLTPDDTCHFVTEFIAERREGEGRVHTGKVVDVAPG